MLVMKWKEYGQKAAVAYSQGRVVWEELKIFQECLRFPGK